MPDVYESFDKANSSTLGPNHAWTETGTTTFEVISNRLSGNFPDNASGQARADVTLDTPDFYAEITITSLEATSFGNTSLGPIVRSAVGGSVGDFYALELHNLDKYFFWKSVGGTRTDFATSSGTALTIGTLPGTLRLEAKGSTITAYWRGATLKSVTDTSIPSGRGAGVFAFQLTSVSHADDFRARTPIKLATFTGSIKPAGTLATRRIVFRILEGSVALAGALANSVTRIRTFEGSTSPAGALVKRPTRRLVGSSKPTGVLRRRFSRIFSGATTPVGDPGIEFLGRVLGRAGTVIMKIRRAGEVRMRFRKG